MLAERDQLWARLEKASFLTVDEKRAAAGYGALAEGEGGALASKFNPYHDELGRFTTADGAGGGGSAASQRNDDGLLHGASRRRAYPGAPIAQQIRLDQAHIRAQSAARQLRELDPDWRAPQSLTATIEGETAHWEAVARSAEARLGHILRDAIPGSNPSWGVNRLTKELYDQGYVLRGPARGAGLVYHNPSTGAEVRIMQRPSRLLSFSSADSHPRI